MGCVILQESTKDRDGLKPAPAFLTLHVNSDLYTG
jgi:hypothetical protein